MLKCPHCKQPIEDREIARHMNKKGRDAQIKKYGEGYSDEMRRRVNKRWKK